MIRVLRAVRPNRLSLAVTTATKRRGEAGQPALLAHREQGRVGDRGRVGAGRRRPPAAAPDPSSAADQQGERAAAARNSEPLRRRGPSLPLAPHQPAPLEIDQMRQHRAARGRVQPRIDVAVHGRDHHRDPPLPFARAARGSASRASGGGGSGRGHGRAACPPPGRGPDNRPCRRGRAACRGSHIEGHVAVGRRRPPSSTSP